MSHDFEFRFQLVDLGKAGLGNWCDVRIGELETQIGAVGFLGEALGGLLTAAAGITDEEPSATVLWTRQRDGAYRWNLDRTAAGTVIVEILEFESWSFVSDSNPDGTSVIGGETALEGFLSGLASGARRGKDQSLTARGYGWSGYEPGTRAHLDYFPDAELEALERRIAELDPDRRGDGRQETT